MSDNHREIVANSLHVLYSVHQLRPVPVDPSCPTYQPSCLDKRRNIKAPAKAPRSLEHPSKPAKAKKTPKEPKEKASGSTEKGKKRKGKKAEEDQEEEKGGKKAKSRKAAKGGE